MNTSRPGKRGVRAIMAALGAIVLLAGLSGCGLLGGDDSADSGNGILERTKIKVGAMTIIDSAPVQIAQQQGFFKQEGLDVELVTIPGAAAAVPSLVSGDLQFTYGAWVGYIQAQTSGIADLKLIADSYQTGPGIFMIMVKSGSPITKASDLVGKKIATNTFNSITDLLAKSTLATNGVDPKSVTFVEVPFPDMQARLQSNDIDAAVMLEPYVTRAERETGATPLLDTSDGPTKEFPISGYAATAKFANENPKTTEAFRRAVTKASALAADRQVVETAVQSYAKIDKDTAALLKIATFPTTMDPTRLQRVADLMLEYGMLKQPFDVSTMIIDSARK